MAHGYLGDGYGKNGMRDPDGGRNDDERDDRRNVQRGEWRDRDRDREGRDREDRSRGRFMFENRDHDRGFVARTADEARDWFREDEHDYRPSGQQRGRERGRNRDMARQQPRGERFSGDEHSHYRDWRQQQIDALDRDYADYCSERQQQFHQDFDSWRRNRSAQPSGRQSDELELTAAQEMDSMPGGTTDTGQARGTAAGAIDTATLGTNNSENSRPGRS